MGSTLTLSRTIGSTISGGQSCCVAKSDTSTVDTPEVAGSIPPGSDVLFGGLFSSSMRVGAFRRFSNAVFAASSTSRRSSFLVNASTSSCNRLAVSR